MIAKAKAISHGINDIRYITGESHNKKHPEKIYRILDNMMPSEPDAMGVWNSMQLTLSAPSGEELSHRIELSPSPEHTKDFTIEDWQNFGRISLQSLTNKCSKTRMGKYETVRPIWPTANTQFGSIWNLIAEFHIFMLPSAGWMKTDRSTTNHNIHLRAQWAAERVAKKRRWTIAKQIRNINMPFVTRDCMNVLKSMSSWSWDEYKAALTKKGYTIHERKDDDGILHGYAIMKGKTKYKASDLGIGRNLMVSKLPTTWEKLHYRSGIAANNKPKDTDSKQIQKPSASADYTQYKIYNPNTVPYTLSHEGQEHRLYIPEKVLNHFNDEFDYRFVSNSQELTDMAVAIFVGLLEVPNAPTGGGGGSQSELSWRDKDEDDLLWAKRCARAAIRTLGKKPKTGLKR